jgi:CBS domain-containing protein
MSKEVVLLPAEMSLPAAARLLYRMQISGAPVVDETGRCVGVLSTTDFMHCVERGPGPAGATCGQMHSAWEIHDEAAPDETRLVRDFMTRDLVTVPPGTSLPELARTILEAHIHRLVVADHDLRPLGIVSTTDILAALTRATGIGLDHPAAAPEAVHPAEFHCHLQGRGNNSRHAEQGALHRTGA